MANISKFRANLKHINQIAVMHRETERVETNPAAQHVSQTENTREKWRERERPWEAQWKLEITTHSARQTRH